MFEKEYTPVTPALSYTMATGTSIPIPPLILTIKHHKQRDLSTCNTCP